jgi:hypothetical protein
MLIAHGAVEAPLRDLVARRREMHLAELLFAVVLRKRRRCAGEPRRRRDRSDCFR